MLDKVFDFAVIGSGSVGSAAGYYASKENMSVLELDSHRPPHEFGSHHGQTRIIRHAYGEGEKYLPLVLRAQSLWNELEKESDEQLLIKTGVLNIGPKNSHFMENVKRSAIKYHLDVEEFSSVQVSRRWPGFALPDSLVGLFEKNAGYLYSEKAIKNYIYLAAKYGAFQDFSATVTDVRKKDDVFQISTGNSLYFSKYVLISAGTWVKRIFPEVPIQPVRKVFTWYNAPKLYENHYFPAFTFNTGREEYYGFPARDGLLKVGKHTGGQKIDSPNQRLPFGEVDTDYYEVKEFVEKYLPRVEKLNNGASCTYDLSPDEDFIVDQIGEDPDIQIVTGLSGHGFKFSSALGQLIVKRILTGHYDIDLSAFSMNRF